MMLELNSWEARLLLEAMRALDAKWSAVIDSSDDEDIQSEYGNDLAQLQLVHERIEVAACEEFGPTVSVFSRTPIGSTPKH